MGPAATVDFLRRIVESTPAAMDQDHLHLLVDSDPAVPDRTAAILKRGPDPSEHLAMMARRLVIAGAELLVMPCNSAYAFADGVRRAVAVPLVDWPAEVASALNLAGARRAGLLMTTGTRQSGIYQAAFERFGIDMVLPDVSAQQPDIMKAIYGREGVKALGPASVVAGRQIRRASQRLIEDGADIVVLACTELSALVTRQPLDEDVPLMDAADVVAQHVVTIAMGRRAPPDARCRSFGPR